MNTIVAAVVAAFVSGVAGVSLGAWLTSRHDRTERLRARRIDAADDVTQAWMTASWAIDASFKLLKEDGAFTQRVADATDEAYRDLVAATSLIARFNLLFAPTSHSAQNLNNLIASAHKAIEAISNNDVEEASKRLTLTGTYLSHLVASAGLAIFTTGSRGDSASAYRSAQGALPSGS